ncbi:MAG: dihydroorotate dehydrogenase-like protein [Geminicoccaceae bacterium]
MDLHTTYLGLDLKNPLVASASPISRTLDGIKRLEDSSTAAIVLPSLFEEHCQSGTAAVEGAFGPEAYLDLIRRAVGSTDIPIIASLNGITDQGWTMYAKTIEEAGAAALELNIYYIPADIETTSADVEQRYIDVLRAVKETVKIPVSMKLSPYFSAFGAMAKRVAEEGADGLVLFNRFYQPDIDLAKMAILPTLDLSNAHEARLPLLWIAVLSRRVQASIAATTGVERAEQVIKYLLVGADVVMTTSSLLRDGPQHMADLVRGLAQWMYDHDYAQLSRIRGALSHSQAADPTAFVRANYVDTLKG